MLYNRLAENVVRKNMEVFPAVAVLGSRQCGKSTLIKMMAENGMNMLYLDSGTVLQSQRGQDHLFRRDTACSQPVRHTPQRDRPHEEAWTFHPAGVCFKGTYPAYIRVSGGADWVDRFNASSVVRNKQGGGL